MTGTNHPLEEELAALADGRLDRSEAEPIERHLTDCRACMAAYADAVRYRAGWLASPESFEPTPGLIGDSMAMLRRGRPETAARAVLWRRVALAAGAVGLVLVTVIVVRTVDRSRAQERQSLPAPIRVALEELSGRGLVLPGGEAGALPSGPVLRSGFERPAPELDAAIREAIDRFNADKRAAAYPAAAGLHSCGRNDDARDYVVAGLRRDPSDVRLLILRADIAYRSSDLDLAERYLRRALALRRDHPVATLDLGIVLAERENRAEAMRLFERAARHGTPPLVARARREAETLQAR